MGGQAPRGTAARDPDTYRAWLAGEPVRPGGDGEGRGDVGGRVMAAIDDVMGVRSRAAPRSW